MSKYTKIFPILKIKCNCIKDTADMKNYRCAVHNQVTNMPTNPVQGGVNRLPLPDNNLLRAFNHIINLICMDSRFSIGHRYIRIYLGNNKICFFHNNIRNINGNAKTHKTAFIRWRRLYNSNIHTEGSGRKDCRNLNQVCRNKINISLLNLSGYTFTHIKGFQSETSC